MDSNLDPNNLELTLENIENFEVIHGNSEQGKDLEDKDNLNEKNSTDNNDLNNSLIEDKSNNQSKQTECTTEDLCDNDEAGLTKSPASVQINTEESLNKNVSNKDEQLKSIDKNVSNKDEQLESLDKNLSNKGEQLESLDKNISNKDEQLSTVSEIIHDSNTNITDSQSETIPAEDNISEEQKNSETTEENSQGDESNIPMIVVKENPRESLDDSSNNKKLNNLHEDEQLSDNKENKRLLSKGNMENEMIEVLTDLGNNDQQEQEQQQQQQPLPEGWKRETVLRSRKNKMDVYYISPTGIRLRCEAEVYQYCEREGLQIDLSIFDFGFDEVDLTDSDTSLTLSSDDSSDDEVVWASTGVDGQNKKSKEPSAKANALNPFDIVNSQISKRIYIGHDIVLRPKEIPYKATVNAKRPLPEFLENYTVLRYDDYLAFRTKEMFWQEPFMKCIYQAISERKIRMMEAAELVGVKHNKFSHEYHEFTNSPWLTEAFTDYLGTKSAKENQDASTSQNSQIAPIRAASPSQKVLSTSRPGSYTPSAERVTTTFLPPNLLPTKDVDNMLKKCSCKKSHCLMASCPCFNNFGQCINCKCKECHNTDKDPKREAAMKKRLTKMYPSLAKDLKVSNAAAMAAAVTVEEMMRKGKQLQEAARLSNGTGSAQLGNQTNNVKPFGCTCKGNCQKKNCGCYSKGLNCSDACLCLNCTNRIMIQSIFNTEKPENNLPLNTLSSVSPGGMESITDTIRRLFPQVQILPQPASVSNTNPNNISNVSATKVAPPNMVVIPHTMHSGSPDVVAITTVPSSVSSVVPLAQQRSNIPSSNAIRGLEDKETFLHKWVEANYKIEGSTVWEENLIFLHLRNTVERLGLGHVVTIRQLREALRKVFGPAVGPNKNLGTSHWVYNGIKPVLAYSSNNNKNNNSSKVLTTSSSSEPPGSTAQLTVLNNIANVTLHPEKGNNAAQMVASVSSVSVGNTTEVPHSIGPPGKKQNTGNHDSSYFDESHKILCINAWLKENFVKSPGTINIDSLYQKCLSNLTTTNKIFSISEFINCVKSVFGPEVGPVPCADNKGIIQWNFLGICSKDVAVNSTGKSLTGAQMSAISSSVMEASASSTNNDTPMVRIHSIESLATPSANSSNNVVASSNESQKLAALNVISWLKENYVRAPGTLDVDSLYQKYLSNLKAPNKEIDVSEFIHCVKILFGEDIGPNPCYDDKGNIRWHYVGIWSKDDAEISTANGHAEPPTESVMDSDDDVCIIDTDNATPVDPNIDEHFRRSLGGDYQHLLRKAQPQVQHNKDKDSEEFCPVIEAVYSEPQNSQSSIAHPTIQQKVHPAPVGPPSLSGPHGLSRPPVLSGPHGMSRGPLGHIVTPTDGGAGNVIPPGATMLKNSTGSSVARAVEVGIRVQRGPDWIHGDEDGHGLGSVTELSKNGTVRVIWDCNKHKSSEGEWYNMGLNGKYRLRPADDAPSLPVPELMPSSTLVRPPAPFLVNPSAPPTALGNFHAPPLGHPSAPMFYNPNGPMIGIPRGLMHGNLHGGPMVRPMHLNPPAAPMLLNPFVAAALGNTSGPAPVNLPSPGVFSSTQQEITAQAAASVGELMPIWTHQQIQVGKIVEPGPNWHLLNDDSHECGSVLEVQVIANKQYAKVQWYKGGETIDSIGPSDWGWYCYTTGEIQLCENHSLTSQRSQITHPSGLSRRERKMFKRLSNGPKVCDIEAEEVVLEWLLTNYSECPGAQLAQVDIYQNCKHYMDKRGLSIRGPIVFGNIMRKIYGASIGPRRTEIDGEFRWRYQGIISINEAPITRETIQDPMCLEEIEKMVTDSAQTCSSTFEGHNFSPTRSEVSFSNNDCDLTSGLRISRSPSPMSCSPSPLSSLSPASSMEQLSDIDSHDGTNLDLEENIFDDSGCLSDSDLCDTGTHSTTKQKELPATHFKFPDCPYDPVKERKMWLLYMDTFSK